MGDFRVNQTVLEYIRTVRQTYQPHSNELKSKGMSDKTSKGVSLDRHQRLGQWQVDGQGSLQLHQTLDTLGRVRRHCNNVCVCSFHVEKDAQVSASSSVSGYTAEKAQLNWNSCWMPSAGSMPPGEPE